MRGRAPLCNLNFLKEKKMSKHGKDRTQPTGDAKSLNHGVKNIDKVGNKCGPGAGKGQWQKVGKVNPGSNKGTE